MRSARFAVVFAAALFVVLSSEAQPQPQPSNRPAPATLATLVVAGADDPIVVAELKLTDDQQKALVSRRTELWNEQFSTSPKQLAASIAEQNKATDALLRKTLSAEQYKRATQLGLQSFLDDRNLIYRTGEGLPFRSTGLSAGTYARFPETAVAFQLTDDQKKTLEQAFTPTDEKSKLGAKGTSVGTPRNVSATLTPEQVAAVTAFMGPLAKKWTGKTDPRVVFPVVPRDLALIEAKDVRDHLKLDIELAALEALDEKWTELIVDARADLSPSDVAKQSAAIKAETDKLLATLTPEQHTRLKQIGFQVDVAGNVRGGLSRATSYPIEEIYTNPTVVKELGLTDEQTRNLLAVREAFDKDATTVLISADSAAPAETKLTGLAAARRAKAEAVLTSDQTAKLNALVGTPFTGTTFPDAEFRRFGGGPANPRNEAIRAETFGKHSLAEFNLLATNKSIQDELKLDEKQVTKAVAAQGNIQQATIPNPTETVARQKNFDDRSRMVAEELGKLLNEDQAKRFRQIMLQYWESSNSRPGRVSGASAISYPGVADAVKLTEDQKKQLFAGTVPADVLTADQKSAIQKMLGEPFKGTFTVRPLGFPGGGAGSGGLNIETIRAAMYGKYTTELNLLAQNKSIQEELKLTDEQIKQAAEKYSEVAAIRIPFTGDNEAFTKAYAERSKLTETALGKLLNEDQAKRFRQIMLQSREQVVANGDRPNPFNSLNPTVAYPGVADAVKLTEDQKKQLLAGTVPADVLTADQKSAIQKMLGEPFKGTFTVRPTFGGGGGVFPGTRREPASALIRLTTINKAGVEETLKLTPEQTKTFEATWTAYQTALAAIPSATGPGQAAELNQRRADARAAFDKAAMGLLTPAQEKRLTELGLQADAASNLFFALTRPDTAKSLDLTTEQIQKLTALEDDATKLQSLRSTYISVTRDETLGLRLRDLADDRIMAVLTAAQKARWKELTGDPMPGLVKTVPNRFAGGMGAAGGGGFGGGSGPAP